MNAWSEWFAANPTAVWWLVAVSVLMFVVGAILVPVVATQIPHNYFAHKRRPAPSRPRQHPAVRMAVLVVKNAVGGFLVVAGALLLILPGQGLLTILAGTMLLDFPGKYRLERWLVRRGPTLRTINWIRRRADRAPLVFED